MKIPRCGRWASGRTRRYFVCLCLWFVGAIPWMACHSDFAGVPADRSAAHALGTGSVSPLNAILAVGETLSVAMHATAVNGIPTTTFDSVRYIFAHSYDSIYVKLLSNGRVIGQLPTNENAPVQLWIVAFSEGGANVGDEMLVQVVSNAMAHPVLGLTISQLRGAANYNSLSDVAVRDSSTADSISGTQLRLEFSKSDSATVSCFHDTFTPTNSDLRIGTLTAGIGCRDNYSDHYDNLSMFFAMRPGNVWVHASVWAFGHVLHDSVLFALPNPMNTEIQITPRCLFAGCGGNWDVTIRPGGTVTFQNYFDPSLGTSVNITFDHPEAAGAFPDTTGAVSGNIIQLIGGYGATRVFSSSGVYHYSYTIVDGVTPFKGEHGTGTITVQ